MFEKIDAFFINRISQPIVDYIYSKTCLPNFALAVICLILYYIFYLVEFYFDTRGGVIVYSDLIGPILASFLVIFGMVTLFDYHSKFNGVELFKKDYKWPRIIFCQLVVLFSPLAIINLDTFPLLTGYALVFALLFASCKTKGNVE